MVKTLFFSLLDRAIHRLTNVDFTFLDGDHLSINFEDDVIDQFPDSKVTQAAMHQIQSPTFLLRQTQTHRS